MLSLGAAFNAAALLFALPLYSRLYASPGRLGLLTIVVLLQIIPEAGLSAVAQASTRRRSPRRGLPGR